MLKKLGFITVVSLFLGSSATLPAMAQEITDAKLEKAAMAYVEIAMISQEFQESAQEAGDPDIIQQMQVEANNQMINAVEEAYFDVQTYNHIMGEVSRDESLAEWADPLVVEEEDFSKGRVDVFLTMKRIEMARVLIRVNRPDSMKAEAQKALVTRANQNWIPELNPQYCRALFHPTPFHLNSALNKANSCHLKNP